MSSRLRLLALCVGCSCLAQGCANGPATTTVEAAQAAASPSADQGLVRLGTASAANLGAELVRKCKNTKSFECDVLRRLVVGELVRALERAEAGRDQRLRDQAMSVLDLTEEPEIIIAASRLLGHFPDTPNLAGKMVPLMFESAYIQVQSTAAQVLSANPDDGFQDLGRMWTEGHSSIRHRSPYEQYPDFAAHYASIGFPKYSGAEWSSVGDSDRSVGWSTTDAAATVAKWYGDTLHAELLDAEKWNQVSLEQAQVLMKFDPAKMTRMQQLMERGMRGDQAAMAELEKLQKEMDQSQKEIDAAMERSVTKAALIPGTFARDARWIVAAKKGERISRLVVVFPVPQLQRTVIKEIWDLSDYPSAWPQPTRATAGVSR